MNNVLANSGVTLLVPTRCVGMTLHRAAVRDAARLYCIPTRRVGTSNKIFAESGELEVEIKKQLVGLKYVV